MRNEEWFSHLKIPRTHRGGCPHPPASHPPHHNTFVTADEIDDFGSGYLKKRKKIHLPQKHSPSSTRMQGCQPLYPSHSLDGYTRNPSQYSSVSIGFLPSYRKITGVSGGNSRAKRCQSPSTKIFTSYAEHSPHFYSILNQPVRRNPRFQPVKGFALRGKRNRLAQPPQPLLHTPQRPPLWGFPPFSAVVRRLCWLPNATRSNRRQPFPYPNRPRFSCIEHLFVL